MKNKPASFAIKGATILTFAALLGKILSAIYRVPFQNMVGNRGFYIYQQIYPIYGLAMTIGLTGFPVYISKIIAKEIDEKKRNEQIIAILYILLIIGICIFLFLFLYSDTIANFMGDNKLNSLIKSVSWLYLVVPFLSVARGYNQGRQEMIPTALSQLIEQIVRIGSIIIVALVGTVKGWSLYQIGSYAFLGSIVGAFCALVFFSNFFKEIITAKYCPSFSVTQKLFKGVVSEGLVICLFAAILVLLQLVDSFTLKNALQAKGYGMKSAENLKGIYDRSQTLLQLGLVLAMSFSTSLLPTLIKNKLERNGKKFQQDIQLVYRICMSISIAATFGLIVLMPDINKALFGSSQGDLALSISMLTIIFAGIILLDNAILQSTSNYKKNILVLIVIMITKILTNFQFTVYFGIAGAACSSVLSMAIGAFFSKIALKKMAINRGVSNKFLKKAVSCSLIMTFVVLLVRLSTRFLTFSRLANFGQCLLCILVGIISYLYFARYCNLFSDKEWKSIPGGKYIISFFKNRKDVL